ncbi:MAG: PKD domain-containing protein, partial [Prevotellaceae bacterium]|nr:PKD domain-containing protein [Prevotellaceae bacterium]
DGALVISNTAARDSGNYAVNEGGETDFYFTASDKGNRYTGWMSPDKQVSFDAPVTKLPFPFAFGDSVSESYTAHGRYHNDSLTGFITGNYTVVADAYGTVVLPDGRELCNALRIKTIDSYTEHYCKTTEVTIEKYLWYTPYYRFPVFTVVQAVYGYTHEPARDTLQAAYYTLNAMPAPAVKAMNDLTVCVGMTTELRAEGDGILTWYDNTGQILHDLHVKPQQTTTYRVSADIGTCQPAFDEVTVRVAEPPALIPMPDTVICKGSPLTLWAASDCDVRWYRLDYDILTPLDDQVVYPESAARYVVISENAPCPAVSGEVLVSVMPLPATHFTVQAVRNLALITFSAPLSPAVYYSLDFGDGTVQPVGNTTVVHKYTESGDYVVTLTATPANTFECPVTVAQSLTIAPAAEFVDIAVFPNPATTLLQLMSVVEIRQYQIAHASTGVVCDSRHVSPNEMPVQIALNGLLQGWYVIHLETPAGWVTQTFVKE